MQVRVLLFGSVREGRRVDSPVLVVADDKPGDHQTVQDCCSVQRKRKRSPWDRRELESDPVPWLALHDPQGIAETRLHSAGVLFPQSGRLLGVPFSLHVCAEYPSADKGDGKDKENDKLATADVEGRQHKKEDQEERNTEEE